jgi:rod shape-determining protein MreC
MSLLLGLMLTIAWKSREIQGTLLSELYYWLTLPWQPTIDPHSVLSQAAQWELKAQVTELQYQNRELKKLLGLTETLSTEAIPAAVLARSADSWWQQLTLTKGSQAGVKVGDIVVAPGGLIGKVERVSASTSRVLLISDPSSQVGVMVSRTREMGVLQGTGTQQSILEFFEKEPDVALGDIVVTSGLSSLYPAGIVIGQVRSIDLDASPAPQATIELAAPLGLLEWGLIYAYTENTLPLP